VRALGIVLLASLALAATQTTPGTAGLDPDLDGRAIYARVLENRFATFTQESRLASGDRAGRVQETRLEMVFKDFRDAEKLPSRGVVSKTLLRYTHPFDLRHSGYLVIQNHARANDQFLYLSARRKTMRVNLRGEAVFGTDFSFEDVIPRELEDATYERLPDGTADGRAAYVVEAHPTERFDSEYSKFVFYVDPETFVPLRTRYWDQMEIEVKELVAPRESVQDFGGVFVPMVLTMRNLVLESYTTLQVTNFVPNPKLPESIFEVRRLESH
jgi:hypothetical protein